MSLVKLINAMEILDLPLPNPLNYFKAKGICWIYEKAEKEFLLSSIKESNFYLKTGLSSSKYQQILKLFAWFISGPLNHAVKYSINYCYLYPPKLLKPLSYTEIAQSYLNLTCLQRVIEILDTKTTELAGKKLLTGTDGKMKKINLLDCFLICLFKAIVFYPLRFLHIRASMLNTGLFFYKDLKHGVGEAINNLRSGKIQRNGQIDFYRGFEKYFLLTLMLSIFNTYIFYYQNPSPKVPLRIHL